MINVSNLEVRVGARLLLDPASFRVGAGRQGRAGRPQRRRQDHPHQDPRRRGRCPRAARSRDRRGRLPAAGPAHRRPRGARPRPDPVRARPRRRRTPAARAPRRRWAATTPDVRERAMRRYDAGRRRAARRRWVRRRGRGRADRGAASASRTGVLGQPLRTLSGGQRRRVELARILFSGAETLLLDEPTNHLDADSIVWLRDFLKSPPGRADRDQPRRRPARGRPSTRCFHLDANRGRDRRLQHGLEGLPARSARPTSAAASASGRTPRSKATTLIDQANKMRAKATKARPRPSRCCKRAERLMAGLEGERAADRVARITFPDAGAVRQDAADRARSCRSRTARSRSSPTSTWRSTRARRVVDPRPQRRRQDHAAADPRPASTSPTPARSSPGHGLKLGYYAQEHETLDTDRTVLENMQSAAPAADRHRGPQRARLVPVLRRRRRQAGRRCCRAARRPGSRWRPWSSRAPTCCCSTSRPTTSTPPPARRCSARSARYEGAIVLVTHDEGAVARARAGPGAAPARRRRGPLERRLRRPGVAGLTYSAVMFGS